MSVTMPLLSIKDLAVAISTRAGPAEDDPPLHKLGSKPVQAVSRERVELLIELFWEVREKKHLAEMPLPLAHFFQRLSLASQTLLHGEGSCQLRVQLLSHQNIISYVMFGLHM